MIITIQQQVSKEERNQLETLLEHVTGNHKQTVSTLMDEREVIVLDGSLLDKQALAAISQQRAVENIVEVKTQYQLVSKAFKAESSRIKIGGRSTNTTRRSIQTTHFNVPVPGAWY